MLRTSRRHWPAVWLALHMLSYAGGGYLGPQLPATWNRWSEHHPALVRATAIAPGLLLMFGNLATGCLWVFVAAGNTLAGAMEANLRHARQSVQIEKPWSPAQRLEQGGVAALRITGWVREGDEARWSAAARLLAWQPDSTSTGGVVLNTGVYLSGRDTVPKLGEVITGPVQLTAASESGLAGSFDYRKFLGGRGLKWRGKLRQYESLAPDDPVSRMGASFLNPLREQILGRLNLLLPPREAELAAAVLLGKRSQSSKQISAPFTSLGLAHLFAVSGLHVGILLGIILLPGKMAHFSPRFSVAPLWLFVPLYLLLTGLPGSVVRAGGMGLLAAQARPLGRRHDPLRLLGLLYWWGTLWQPSQNLDVGLQLSYLAAGGILLLSRVTEGFRFADQPLLRAITTGLAVGFAAQWFTMPVIASSFGYLSLLSPLANLLAVPMFALAIWCVVLALSLGVVWLPLGQLFGALAWLLLRTIGGAVSWLAQQTGGLPLGLRVPGPGLVAVWILLSTILLIVLHRRPNQRGTALVAWAILPGLLLLVFSPVLQQAKPRAGPEVWQFAVGQGDCGLVQFPDGWVAMIDTGGRFGHHAAPESSPLARTILPHLRRQGIGRLDMVMLSHGHFDHTGGAAALSQAVGVDSWLVAGRADRAVLALADSNAIRFGQAGDVLHSWRDWELVVVYPLLGQMAAEGENNWSLVIALKRAGRTQFVWSGDLELAGEETMLASEPGLGPTRIWKAGHHGSNTSGSPEMMAVLQPELILVSCGVGNGYHHPSHGPFWYARDAALDTVPLLRTDLSGSIHLRWAADGAIAWQTRDKSGKLPPPP